MPRTQKSLTVAPDSPDVGGRVDRVVQLLCGWSRAQVIGLFDHGCVRLNGEPCDLPSLTVAAGDEVQLIYDPAQRYHPKKKPRRQLGFDIVFEDRHLIVVVKPAGLLTVPTERGESNTLVEKVSEYLRHVARCPQAFIVHRLDRGVSGLLVFGKTASIAHAIREQFASHKPEREYVALVSGHLREDRGTFNSVLATDRNLNRYSTRDSAAGQRAITHFQVLRRLGDSTLVRIWLETGRRNQIRVHFAEAGHPILGDTRYQRELATHPRWPPHRLALHARQLGFTHPVTGKHLHFVAPLPCEMERFVAAE